MKQCWPEGDLRAYLDGELAAECQEEIGAHLKICAACSASYSELSARARRMSNLMAALPPTPVVVLPVLPVRERHGRRWAAAALALAAGLAIGFLLLPKREIPTAHPLAQPAEVVSAPASLAVAAARTPVAARPVRHAAARPTVLRADFVRLDDEPLETGRIVRVSAENGDVQAELLVGPDGRAHAIRVVGNQKGDLR